MKISNLAAIVTGGGSGLGEATAVALNDAGAKVAILDFNENAAQTVSEKIGGIGIQCDVSDEKSVAAALETAGRVNGDARILVNCAGIAPARRILGRDGAMPLNEYRRVIETNLIGTFNVLKQFAEVASKGAALATGERGVIVNTASVAAYEGQIGQSAYASSKAGVVGLTITAAREFARDGIRVCTIAPGIFETAMLRNLPEAAQASLGQSVPFPSRLGRPEEFASLVLHIVQNEMMNGETIRLDGAIRMAPR
jgi:NAD(P)-dependent dehydrogenase (short-subunit alcohol dehydrogenase family)